MFYVSASISWWCGVGPTLLILYDCVFTAGHGYVIEELVSSRRVEMIPVFLVDFVRNY